MAFRWTKLCWVGRRLPTHDGFLVFLSFLDDWWAFLLFGVWCFLYSAFSFSSGGWCLKLVHIVPPLTFLFNLTIQRKKGKKKKKDKRRVILVPFSVGSARWHDEAPRPVFNQPTEPGGHVLPRGLDRDWDPASGLLLYRVVCRVKIFSASEIFQRCRMSWKWAALWKDKWERMGSFHFRYDNFTRLVVEFPFDSEIHLIYDQRSWSPTNLRSHSSY